LKTDNLFYQIFSASPALVFELIGSPFPRASTYGFGSQEVKETSFRIDGILTPPPYASDLPIVFVEVQGYRDTKGDLYPSFFSEIYLYLNDYRPPNNWQAVLIFTQRRFDPGISQHYQEFENSFRLKRVYLDELPEEVAERSLELGVVKLLGMRPKAAPERAKQLIKRARQEITDVHEQGKILELVETALVYLFPTRSSQEIAIMLGISELKQTRVYQDALQEEALRFVSLLLTRQYGELEIELQAQMQQLSRAQLEELGEALLDFSSVEDLVVWLQSHQ
jgi:predicted transposase YdaD